MESVTTILKAVEARNFELAHRTALREVSKNEESDLYLSLVVYTAGLVQDRDAVREFATKASQHASPKTTRMFLAPTLIRFGFKDLLMQSFSHGNRLAPQDGDHLADWVQAALQFGDLNACQKALMASVKLNKKPRLTAFCLCLVMALCNEQKPNTVFQKLGEKMLEKHLPAQSPEECYVACLVYGMSGPERAVEYLQNSADLFTESSLDLQLILLAKLLELKAYTQLFAYSKMQIKRIDSYNYFQALNTAAVALNQADEAETFCKELQGCNSQLSLLDLAQKRGIDTAPALLNYWAQFKSKPSTAEYLKPFISTAHIPDLENTASELPELVNLYKLKKFLNVPISVPELVARYNEFKHLKPAEKTDYFVGTDLLVLAADLLLEQCAEQHAEQYAEAGSDCSSSSSKYGREQAAALLLYSLQADPLNFESKVRLIYIYRSLNCFGQALALYNDLRIQNLQQDTLGHLLYARLGSTAPQFTKKLQKKLETNRANQEKAGLYAQTALEMGAFTKFKGIVDLGVQLSTNKGLCVLDLEKVKSERAVRGTPHVSELCAWLRFESEEMQDVRDFSTIVNLCPVGPVQSDEYISIYCSLELQAKKKQVAGLASKARISKELTSVEKWQIEVLEWLCADKSASQTASSLPPALALPAVPAVLDWSFYNWCYTVLDTAKLASFVNPAFDAASLKSAVYKSVEIAINGLEKYIAEAQKSIEFGDAKKLMQTIRKAHKDALKEEVLSPK